MTDSLTPLEERRLAEFRHYVSARALDQPASKPRRIPQPKRPFVPALALTAVAATAVAATLFIANGGTTPRTTGHSSAELTGYTVKRAPDGIVTITLTDYRNTSQLSSQLQAAGIPAVVVYVPQNEYCQEPDATPVPGPPDYSMPGGVYTLPQFQSGGGWRMQINPSHIKPGQSLIFGISTGKEKVTEGGRAVEIPFNGSFTSLVTGKLTACQYHPGSPVRNPGRPSGVAPTPPPGFKKGSVVTIDEGAIKFGK